MQKILTIAIPTFNRENDLEWALSCLYNQYLDLSSSDKDLLSICISDNNSTDNTKELVEKYRNIFIIDSNTTNIGADNNILKCYNNADSKYVLIMGDDDYLLPGSLSLILHFLKNNDVDVLYLNNTWYTDKFNIAKEKIVDDLKVDLYDNSALFLKKIGVMISFISAVIIKTKKGVYFQDFCNSTFLIQFSWVLSSLDNGNKFAYANNVTVAARGQIHRDPNLIIQIFSENLYNNCVYIFLSRKNLIDILFKSSIVSLLPNYIIQSKLIDNSKNNLKKIFKYISCIKKYPFYYYIILIILFSPTHISRLINFALKTFLRLRKFI